MNDHSRPSRRRRQRPVRQPRWRALGAALPLTLLAFVVPNASAAPGDLDTTFSGDGLLTADLGFGGDDYGREVATAPGGKAVVLGDTSGFGFQLARYNSDGSLDTSFSGDGKLRNALSHTHVSDVAVQADGKIVVVGTDYEPADGSFGAFATTRYNTDGSLDTTFAGDGEQTVSFGEDGGADAGGGVAIQPDGKIVLAGVASDDEVDDSDFAVVRLQSDGAIDSSFSGDGKASAEGIDSEYVTDVALHANGKTVLGGYFVEDGVDGAVAQFNADGSVDTSFSADGIATEVELGSLNASVATQADGKVIFAGDAYQSDGPFVARFNADGSRDTGFSGEGIAPLDFDPSDTAVQPDGKIVAVGGDFTGFAGGTDFAVARLGTDGSPDSTFSGDGAQSIAFTGGRAFAAGLALEAGGKLVVAGTAFTTATGYDFALGRLNADGSLDNGFSGDGKQTTDFAGNELASATAVQPDGKIVVAGGNVNGSGDFVISRFNTDGSSDTTFSGDGRQTVDFGGSDAVAGVALSPGGKIVAAGASDVDEGDRDPDAFAIARLNADGSLDTSFSGDGKQTSEFGTNGAEASDVAVQSDGKVVAVGAVELFCAPDCGRDFAVARYDADGALDSSFSGDGRETNSLGDYDAANALALQSDGKIVVVGESDNQRGGRDAFAAVRYSPDGALDPTFSGDGKVELDGGGRATSVALQGNGKIVAVGDRLAVRYNLGGSLDSTFSGDGRLSPAVGGGAVAIQGDGKIVVGGRSLEDEEFGNLRTDFAIARYHANGALDTGFSADGVQTADFGSAPDDLYEAGANDVAIQADGRLVLVGGIRTSNEAGLDMALARFEGGDGPSDTTPPDTSITGGPSGTTSDRTPTFTFTSTESGSSFECRVDTDAFETCSSPYTTPTLPNGPHTFQVRAIDAPGNIDPIPASRSFTVAAGSSTTPPSGGGSGGSGGAKKPGGSGPTIKSPAIGGSSSAGSAKVSSKGVFSLAKQSVDCTGSGPDCAVKTAVSASIASGKASSAAKKRKVKLGKSSFKVKAGKKGKVTVKLTKKGLKLLKRLKRIKSKVTITVKRGTKTVTKTVTLTLKAPKARKK